MLLLQATLEAVASNSFDAMAITYFNLALKGGFTMYIIVAMSAYAGYLTFIKFVELKKVSNKTDSLSLEVRNAVSSMNRSKSLRLCQEHKSPFGRILEKAVLVFFLHPAETDPIKEVIENQCDLENHLLERNLSRLAVIATLAPMTGFLGTVLGILTTFMAMAQENGGTINPNLLSEGMYQAMVTTVAGLIVGIMAHGAYFFLARRLSDITYNMKKLAYDFMGMVHGSIEENN